MQFKSKHGKRLRKSVGQALGSSKRAPVFVRSRLKRFSVRAGAMIRLVRRILERMGESQAEVSLEFVGNHRMRRLNRVYRKKDRTTDVLAFPMREARGPNPAMLGDVVISLPVARVQSVQYGHSLDEEVVRLLVHGMLHLQGYDHERGVREARRMQRKESMILRSLHPYPKLVALGRSV